jgi:hypothetical protein
LPRPTALYDLVNTFGTELQQAENSLAALMRAHWVDHADQREEFINDLAQIAALYGLSPRPEEDVERFREHLKRYVRTFLEGTVTVQGVLRVAAEVLGLRLADSYGEMMMWWTPGAEVLTTIESRGEDAAALLFGFEEAVEQGEPARPARMAGQVDLSGGVDVGPASKLRLKVDSAAAVDVDLSPSVANPAAATLNEIVQAINNAMGARIASSDGQHLVLTSPTTGPASSLEVIELPGDAAPLLWGGSPRTFTGADAASAQATGTVDLSAGADLREARYLRLLVDGTLLAEVDCAGPNPQSTTLEEVVAAINGAFGTALASRDGHFLKLTSPTKGFASRIAFQSPAVQDAREVLLGSVATSHLGSDARSARLAGKNDLSTGADLSSRSKVRVRVDGLPELTVNCAGSNPGRTTLDEIVSSLNAALGATIASHDGRFVRLTSPTVGAASLVAVETLPVLEDASEIIFGLGERVFQGRAATQARLEGSVDLSSGLDLRARHLIRIALDGGTAKDADVRQGIADPGAATLQEIVTALNASLSPGIASHTGRHLVLSSPTVGGASRIDLQPVSSPRILRFVTRAFFSDEAAQLLFGFPERRARGEAASRARLVGDADLTAGVDLREKRFLRIRVDNGPLRDVDCAAKSPRPRVALLEEVVEAINSGQSVNVASHDGRGLVLTSPTAGAASLIDLQPPRPADALDRLLGVDPEAFAGRDATRVRFVATVDLSGGVDLSTADLIRLGVDGATPVEISCAGTDPARTTLSEIVSKINVALGANVAFHDGRRVTLASRTQGSASELMLEVPSGPDATKAIFGIAAPRHYRGAAAAPARVKGKRDLSGGLDLSVARFLRIRVGTATPVEIDCAATAANPALATLPEIINAINTKPSSPIASTDGKHLILSSVNAGSGAVLELQSYTSADARPVLLGQVSDQVSGSAARPAVITGDIETPGPVNLAERRILRIAVDAGRPVDVDVAGAVPEATSLAEVVERINAVLPGLASATDADRLRLTSPTAGPDSRLELLPLRALEVVEYPQEPAADPSQDQFPRSVRHGDRWRIENRGVAETNLEIEIRAPQGAVGPGLVNTATGERIRLLTALRPGDVVRVWREPQDELRATVVHSDGAKEPLPAARILVGPLGAQAWVPFAGEWRLAGGDAEHAATLLLNHAAANRLVEIRARRRGSQENNIRLQVREAVLGPAGPMPVPAGQLVRLAGKVSATSAGYRLVDAADGPLAEMRPGPGVALETHRNRIVAAEGLFHPADGGLAVLLAQAVFPLFDVTVRLGDPPGAFVEETYSQVAIGFPAAAENDLVQQINIRPSQLVVASVLPKSAVLTLPRGRSEWLYTECHAARFNRARFNHARFPGGLCRESAIFNVSRFARTPLEPEAAVFAAAGGSPGPPMELRFRWMIHRPGAFVVNLPADLPEEFGGRFNQARFGSAQDAVESYPNVFTEPPTAEDCMIRVLSEQSKLVEAAVVPRPPIGFQAAPIPFRRPRVRKLSGGTNAEPARLYVSEKDVPGFIEIRARKPGAWGNAIALTVRKSGPARYDVALRYDGARFENAREMVLLGRLLTKEERSLPDLPESLLKPPGPVGVLHAKAAGVRASVSRDRAESNS